MPEAEDVLLEAAERATYATRDLWRRLRPESTTPFVTLSDEQRRISVWIGACFGRAWPLAPIDAPLRPSWLARVLGRPAPWRGVPAAISASDGRQIFLPRRLPIGSRDRLLLMALGQARKLARDASAALPSEPLARDLTWVLESALSDAWLARELPGLASGLDVARATALRARPALERLRPGELAVEMHVRRLLSDEVSPCDLPPAELRRHAETLAREISRAGYRGMAPVPHWGVALRGSPARPSLLTDPEAVREPVPTVRTRTLPHRVQARDASPDELEGRPGPFVLPFGDPQLSVQDPAGLVRPVDTQDDEDAEALASELARLPEAARVQSNARVREVLASEDLAPELCASGRDQPRSTAEEVWLYPEWERARDTYRPAHCWVREISEPASDDGEWSRRLAARAHVRRELRKRFEALRPRRVRSPRQPDGDELDLDAFVAEFAERRAGGSPAGRIYTQERRERRDAAVALLIDASGSTDALVSREQRIIDVEKEAVLCFCEALDAVGDRHAVFSFSGRGPRNVRMARLKAFEERLGAAVRGRIGAVAPDAFTRLGAALRHVTARLSAQPARLRLLLVLSDGKPYDEDEYSGAHGIDDVRQAVAEARRVDVRPFCVNVDRDGASYLPRMFGPGGYALVRHVGQLPERLTEVYRRLTAR